jgi:hypothetical protein
MYTAVSLRCTKLLCITYEQKFDFTENNIRKQMWLVNYIHIATVTSDIFRQSTSTCFGHIFSPSSGSILYVYCTCPKHVEVDWRNKLRINSASSWL